MTNSIAIVLGTLIAVGICYDVIYFGADHLLFLSKKFDEFIEWVAFWR